MMRLIECAECDDGDDVVGARRRTADDRRRQSNVNFDFLVECVKRKRNQNELSIRTETETIGD